MVASHLRVSQLQLGNRLDFLLLSFEPPSGSKLSNCFYMIPSSSWDPVLRSTVITPLPNLHFILTFTS